MQNDKLLHCPFCGGEVELMFTEIGQFEPKVWETEDDTGVLFFQCNGCDSVFTHDEPISTANKMIEWWNTRKPMERIVERLQECKFVTSIGNDIISRNKFIAYNGALNIVRKEGGIDNAE